MNVKLDRRVRIERKAVTRDPDFGTELITWTHVATVWGEARDVLPSRAEAVTQGVAVAKNQTRLRIRYRSDIDSSMRMTISRPTPITYQIIGGPAELGQKEYCEFVLEKYSS